MSDAKFYNNMCCLLLLLPSIYIYRMEVDVFIHKSVVVEVVVVAAAATTAAV